MNPEKVKNLKNISNILLLFLNKYIHETYQTRSLFYINKTSIVINQVKMVKKWQIIIINNIIYWFIPGWVIYTIFKIIFSKELFQITNTAVQLKITEHKLSIRTRIVSSPLNFSTFISLVPLLFGFYQFLETKYQSQFSQFMFQKNLPGLSLPVEKLEWETFQYILNNRSENLFSNYNVQWFENFIFLEPQSKAFTRKNISTLPGLTTTIQSPKRDSKQNEINPEFYCAKEIPINFENQVLAIQNSFPNKIHLTSFHPAQNPIKAKYNLIPTQNNPKWNSAPDYPYQQDDSQLSQIKQETNKKSKWELTSLNNFFSKSDEIPHKLGTFIEPISLIEDDLFSFSSKNQKFLKLKQSTQYIESSTSLLEVDPHRNENSDLNLLDTKLKLLGQIERKNFLYDNSPVNTKKLHNLSNKKIKSNSFQNKDDLVNKIVSLQPFYDTDQVYFRIQTHSDKVGLIETINLNKKNLTEIIAANPFYNFQFQYLNNSNIIETEIKELFVATGMISDLNSFFSTLTNEIIEKLNSDFSIIQLLNSNDHKLSFWDQISKLLSDTEDSINLKLQKGLTDEISSEFHFSANTINLKSHKIKNFETNSIPNEINSEWNLRPDQPDQTDKLENIDNQIHKENLEEIFFLQELLTILNNTTRPIESFSTRLMSGYRYPDMSSNELFWFQIRNIISGKLQKNALIIKLPPNYLSTKKYNFLHFIAPDFSIETKTVTLKNLDVDKNKNSLYEGPSISLDSKTGFDWNIGTTFNFLQSNSDSKNKSNTVLNFQSSKNVTLPITKSLASQVVPNEINLKFDFKEENQKPNLEIPQLINLAEQKLQNELVSPRMENTVGDNITTSIFKPLGIDNLNLKSWLRFYLSPSNPLGTFIKNFYNFDADDNLSKVEPIKDWLQTLPIYTKGFWVNPKVALVNTETKLFLTQPSINIPFISEEQWKHFLSMIEKLQNQLMLDNKANSTISSINNTVVSDSADRKDNSIAIPVISTTIPKIEKPTLEFAVKNKLDYNFNFQLFETRTDSLLNNSLDSIKNLNNISPSLDIVPNEISENQVPIQIITENQKNKLRKETQSTSSDTSMFCGTQNLQTLKFRNNVQLNFIPYTETYLQTHKFNTQLTSGTYKKSNSVFTKNKNLPFQDTWEPLTVQSWLIVSQIGFSFLIFKILKGLADNYGRELLVYLLDLVALLGFLDDDLKQEIEILMGQREKGFRLIYKNQKSFKDIAGMKSLLPEIVEIVWFLRNSAREFALSQTLPKGILLTGPPGTGKTLLVQALAGEAQVPVLALSGSSLLEPGESGALKLEILFQEARRVAPCIVFIDEIDTLAQKREQVLQNSMGTDELLESILNSPILSQSKATSVFKDINNTLNGSDSHQNYFTNNVTEEIQAKQDLRREKLRILMQFLVELDGIQARNGVIVIGATNRPEMLDLAILRPGRFDRILELGLPGPEKRVDILKLYAQRLGYDPNLSWNYLSQLTEGFSAADLAGVMNQSCLKAILLESHHTLESIEHGIDRITISETRALYSQTDSVNNSAEGSNLFPSLAVMQGPSLDHKIKNSETIMQSPNEITIKSNSGLDQLDRPKKQYSTSVLRLAYFQAGKIVLSTLLPHQPPVLLAHLWPRQSNLRSVQIARNTQKYSFRFARKCELEHRIIGCYGGKAAEILFLQKFNSSDSYINLSDIGIEDLSFAQLLIRLMIDKWAFYSSSLGSKTLTEIADNKNFQEYKNLVDKINFLDQTGKDVESINSEQMFEVNNFEKNTSEFITLNDDYAEKYSLIPWWQYQISNELEFSTRTFSSWYRLYLPDPQEKERNLEWSAPDEFFHKNDKLNSLTNSFAGSTGPNWNDLISIKRDYQIHCFVLQSFNKAIKLLDKNREFLDEIAYELIQKEILRKHEIENIKNRFTN